ncbi:hypothetical protein EV199_1629 [Pseudobacter ginsenosidimutans]|uniref:Uncharacterized protein n=2 Tax=Pseudobacter ginsenosidimutans TaxID=661488 RepID=A0A4Q7N438_9BACT|nr:hypothetical protein EV199_1629 [Pseudobacter ginsenosidimutans]
MYEHQTGVFRQFIRIARSLCVFKAIFYFRYMIIRIPVFFIFPLFYFSSIAQQPDPARLLSRTEMSAKFGDSLQFEGMPVFRAYQYQDKGGVYEVLLCEDNATIKENDTANTKLKAVCLISDHGGFMEKWKISDWLVHEPKTEKHIWFWSKYSSFTDLDGDGYIDPVIVYGSNTEDDEVQRVKIITIHKNKKYPVRAVECVLDYCRHLSFDPNFKTLPASIRQYIDKLMAKLRKEQDLILHEG